MNEPTQLYATLLFLSTLISLGVAGLIWPKRNVPGGLALFAFTIFNALWSGTYALYWTNVYPGGLFWLEATFIGVVYVVGLFLVFIIQFTNHSNWLTPAFWGLLIFLPALTLILQWTDAWHGLFYGGYRNQIYGSVFQGGPWFWVGVVAYQYILSLAALGIVFHSLFHARGLYRRQMTLVACAVAIPFIGNIFGLFGWLAYPNFDLTSFLFSLTGILLAYALLGYQFLEVKPVAHKLLINSMTDSVLVVDPTDRIVEMNQALINLLNADMHLIGRPAQLLLPAWPTWQKEAKAEGQDILFRQTPTQYLNVRILELPAHRKQPRGKLVILRDITPRKILEAEREALITSLQESLRQVKTLHGLLPICANCKKIRKDDGYWEQIEVYIHAHTDADFSHGICPDCRTELYPELFGPNRKKNTETGQPAKPSNDD